MVWTLVDAISAYALVETWRARSGASKGKKDTLIAASYVSDLTVILTIKKLTWLPSPYKLLVQPIPVPPIAGVLYIVNIEHAAPAEHHVRCTWSVGIQPNVDSSTTYIVYGQEGLRLHYSALRHLSMSPCHLSCWCFR